MGQVTSSRVRLPPNLSYFPVFFLLFYSQRSRIYLPALGLFKSRDAQPLPGVLRSPWGAWRDGDSTARSPSSPEAQPCSPRPCKPKEGGEKGPVGFSWYLSAGTILLCSPKKLPLKGLFSPSRVKPT